MTATSNDAHGGEPHPSSKEVLARLDLLQRQIEKVDVRSERLVSVEAALDRLERRTEAGLERVEKSTAGKEEETWWSLATKFLGLPALIVLMYLQLSQGREASESAEVRRAEAAKLQTEELKTRAEVQMLLDSLTAKRAASLGAYQQQLDRTLPQLSKSLERLDQLNTGVTQRVGRDDLSRYLVLWVFLQALGVFFTIAHTFWGALVSMTTSALFSWRSHSERAERLRRVVSVVQPALYPLPNVLHVAVDVTLFGAVLIPLFNQLASSLGSQISFQSIVQRLSRLDFAGAIELIHAVVFPG